MSPAKAFEATPEAVVRTNWAVLGFLTFITFGAGGWATWISLKMEFATDQIAEIRADLKDLKNQNNVSKHP
jgi:hypothetical protein